MPILARVAARRAPLVLGTLLIAVALAAPAATLGATTVGSNAAGTPATAADPDAGHAVGAAPSGVTRFAHAAPAPVSIASVGTGMLFKSTCMPSHMAMDDPIVFPGQSGASHMHVFFGNVTTDADSTLATLRGQPTSCRIAEDHAAYWVPALMVNGTPITPRFANAYYLADGARGRIVPFPAGLKVIAGDSHATTAQSSSILGWKCADQIAESLTPIPAACAMNVDQVLVIRFPDCWNGHDLDSADHKSHLRYRVRGVCPAGYPAALPRLSFNVHYRLPSLTGLTLASGSIYSAHADFFNAWNQTVLAALVRRNLD